MKKLFSLLTKITVLGVIACNGGNAKIDMSLNALQSEVPEEVIGAWEHGSIDFELWENYRERYYAGRNATPSREAMIFYKNGKAKFYRYEFALGLYEKLIDCEGTVTFNEDGTFTFYPTEGRKRYYDTHHRERTYERALNSEELADPILAGKRSYKYDGSSDPPALRIKVPGSAPYSWYKKS